MRKTIYLLSVTAVMAGAIFSGCQSPSKKVDKAQDKVQNAQQKLDEAQQELANKEALKAANAEKWETFKSESEGKISDIEVSIAELNAKMKKSGKGLDAQFEKKINALEQSRKNLKTKIEEATNKSQTDWESFKREFNHDMDELGQALKDITVDNKE